MQTAFKISKNIPLPTPVSPVGGRPTKYPWRQMKKGDSIFVPQAHKCQTFSTPHNFAKTSKSKLRFAIRKRTEGGKQGWRVWRIK